MSILTRGTGSDGHVIIDSNGELGVLDRLPDNTFIGSGYTITNLDNNWHTLTAVGNEGQTDFYIDNEYVGTANFQVTDNISTIGGNDSSPWMNPFAEFIDDFKVYDSALTPTTNPAAPEGVKVVSANDVIAEAEVTNLVFVPDEHANGNSYASIDFTVSDGSLQSSTQSITFDVTPINDIPVAADNTVTIDEDNAHTFAAADFGFSDIDTTDSLQSVKITGLPSAGQLTLNGITVTANQVINNADIPNLVFTPATNANGAGYASVQFTVNDGTADSAPKAITFDVTAINDAPTVADITLTINEDAPHPFDVSEFGFNDVDSGDSLQSITITSIPAAGSLTLNSAAVSVNQVITANDIPNLAFTPAANENGIGYADFRFTASDGSASSTEKTITFNVTSLNDAPVTQDNALSINEDTPHTFTTTDFSFTDSDPGDTLQSIEIISLPAAGSLKLNNTAVSVNQVINASDIANLVFTPADNTNGSNYASFQFTVSDGSASSTPKSISFDVQAVNDAPTSADNTLTINEDAFHTFSATEFGFSDVDAGASLQSITITSLPTAGTLELNGSAVNANQVINTADIANLVFTPVANANGTDYASFQFTVSDGSASSTANTMTFNVTPVNDTPTAQDNRVTINEDSSYTFATSDFGFNDIDAGDTLQSVKITTMPTAGSLTLNGSAVSANQSIAAADLGNLVFTPTANASGSSYATIGFTVSDGTAESAAQSISVNVTPVTDTPVISVNNDVYSSLALDSELITNGDFSATSDWSLINTVSILNGQLSFSGA